MQIHQVKGRHVNSYIIESASGLLVIDVARRGEKYVLGYVHEVLHRAPSDIKLVICTHGDLDHAGGVVNLAKICRARIGVPYATQSAWLKFVNDPTGIFFRLTTTFREGLRPRAWTMYANPVRSARAKALPSYLPEITDYHDGFYSKPDFRLKNHHHLPGFEDWEVVHTPGHSWDSCCYFHRSSRSLISGDTLLGSNKKGQLVAPSIFSNPVQMARTIRTLKHLEPLGVYPGHGPSFEGADLLAHF